MLTALQQRIAELFFAMDESAGFALAGGAALIVRGEIDRETHDLDFFADLGVGFESAGIKHRNLVVVGNNLFGDDELGKGPDVAVLLI